MVAKKCLDCGVSYEVKPNEVKWRNYCKACYTIRMNLKEQGLSKEEIDHLRKNIKSAETTIAGIKPYEGTAVTEMKEEYEGFVGKAMVFKELSVSLGEKVSVDYQSKNAQVGVVISLGDYSIDIAYTTALNFVRDKLKERVKKIREEML